MSDRSAALLEAAAYAEFYADERMRLAQDSILHDPLLSGGPFTQTNMLRSKDMQIDGYINSAGYHAAMNIAEHLRGLVRAAMTEAKP